MKGVIFTELIGFIEQRFGIIFMDAVLCEADLPNDGAFTTVGTYPSSHALRLIVLAADRAGLSVDAVCTDYGEHLFDRFGVLFPAILARYATADALLEHVGSHIHEEVRVLYPDARPPRISTERDGASLIVTYASHRPMAHIAYGLIRRSMAAYGDPRTLSWTSTPRAETATFRLSAAQ
ncbi:hypothetical protein HMP09_2077 [Sphingomonas sp. HMP9]|nr:hypothetical protein HMP09_2077 [Sphingomonas sp. HMP9]